MLFVPNGMSRFTVPSVEVTVYPVMVLPPLLDGGVHDNVADAFPPTATTLVTGLGTVTVAAGVYGPIVTGKLCPLELLAKQLMLYATLFVSPVSIAGFAVVVRVCRLSVVVNV